MTIYCTEIPATSALEFWPELQPYIARALAFDLYASTSVDKLKEQVRTGYARVLLCTDGDAILSATLVQLAKNTLDERLLHVVCTAGGKSADWLPVLREHLLEIARSEDCAAVTLSGRPGWARKLKTLGFKMDHVTMRLEADHGISEQSTGPRRVTV